MSDTSEPKVVKTDEQWKQELTPAQYDVLRKAGTEAPFTGEYVYNKDSGDYRCAACAAMLFGADTKFESGTGWPSFTEPAVAEAVELRPDNSLSCAARRSSAALAAGTSGMSSTTARGRMGSATASTRRRSSSTRRAPRATRLR
jgi:peptide-methionine (R)-S-oxide reductase